ncbi:MAG: hypothetical protein IJO75_04140 [Clostridia bacterium]|nr:hypothetical protein [Clostridia bacterium]
MTRKRTWSMVVVAFSLTLCVALFAGGLLLVSIRSGRTLFGENYEPVTLQQELPLDETEDSTFVWLPARLRTLLRVPIWEVQLMEWLLSKTQAAGHL